MSESIYLGQVKISTEIIINGKVKKIENGLTPTSKSILAKNIKEKSKSERLNTKKAYCHLSTNIILNNAIKEIGIDIKNAGTLSEKLNIFKFD